MVSLLGRRRFAFGLQKIQHTVWLVSGSIQFLNEQSHKLRKENCIFITDMHKIWRCIPQSPISLRRLTHEQCGGGTNFTIIFGHTFLHQLQMTPLKRAVDDFIDHSVYALGCSQLPKRYITSDVLYPILDNPVHIHYASKQVCQGWVCRTLTPSELGRLYEFDMNLQFSNIKGMVP